MFNKLFLGKTAKVEISTAHSPEQGELYLSEKFQNRRPDYSWLSNQVSKDTSVFSYSTREEEIKVFFSKSPGFRFIGNLQRYGNGSRLTGHIGISGWWWGFYLSWFTLILINFCRAFLNPSRESEQNALTIFLLVGAFVILFNILNLRKAAIFMKSELEKFFESLNNK